MSDEHRRRLERLGRAAAPAEQARVLLARVRTGELAEGLVVLAAEIGDPGARLVAGAAAEWPTSEARVVSVLAKVRELGKEACVRAAIAFARPRLDDFATARRGRDAEPFRRALAAAEDWLAKRSRQARERAAAAAEAASRSAIDSDWHWVDDDFVEEDDYYEDDAFDSDPIYRNEELVSMDEGAWDPDGELLDEVPAAPSVSAKDEGPSLDDVLARVDVEQPEAAADDEGAEAVRELGEKLQVLRQKNPAAPKWHDREQAYAKRAARATILAARVAAAPGARAAGDELDRFRATGEDLPLLLDALVPWLLGGTVTISPDVADRWAARRPDDSGPDAHEVRAKSAALRAALERLPDEERAVLMLRTVQGLSMEDVAKTLGLSRAAAEERFERATEELRAILDASDR